jgi:citrate lyase subunit beta/citryl-CoA lyase
LDTVRALLLVEPDTSATTMGADATLLNLSDGNGDRATARSQVQNLVDEGHRLYLHVHPVESGKARDDLRACLVPGVYGVSLPRLLTETQLRYIDGVLEELEPASGIELGRTAIAAWLATAGALVEAPAIAMASHRLTWLGLDSAALRDQMQLDADDAQALDYPRSAVAYASRAAGLPAVDGLERERTGEAEVATARSAARLGLRGKLTRRAEVLPELASIFPHAD